MYFVNIERRRKFHKTTNILKQTKTGEVSESHIAVTWQEQKFWKDNELNKSIFSRNKIVLNFGSRMKYGNLQNIQKI
jgi:hypothetical protein